MKYNKVKCDCVSNNNPQQWQKTPLVPLHPPNNWFPHREGRPIGIDACIAHVIQHLWNKKIVTLNSCCGHGKSSPMIVMGDDCRLKKGDRVRVYDEIAKIDDREWRLFVWNLNYFDTDGEFT